MAIYRFFQFLMVVFILQACQNSSEISSIDPVNWNNRLINIDLNDSSEIASSYLSVYSRIYSQTEHKTHSLTSTISMRNTNRNDSIYILKAEYFDTRGNLIRTYFDKAIYIAPMETVEIVIDETDQEGGTGANFIFDWLVEPDKNEPFFEGIMISTSGQQGLSFTTQAKRVN
ncbi:MAG: DUF3124 domain-containing protein [Cytophagales bacterium]